MLKFDWCSSIISNVIFEKLISVNFFKYFGLKNKFK